MIEVTPRSSDSVSSPAASEERRHGAQPAGPAAHHQGAGQVVLPRQLPRRRQLDLQTPPSGKQLEQLEGTMRKQRFHFANSSLI